MSWGLSASLLTVLADDERRERLAALDEAELDAIAERLVERDAYENNARLSAALRLAGDPAPDALHRHVAHVLWCGWREARLRSGAPPSAVRLLRPEHWHSTAGRPTVLLAPMTLCLPDAARLLEELADGRPLVIYGEGLEPAPGTPGRFVPDGLAGLAEIVEVLDAGGVFATYADFVYAGHRHEPMSLFGVPHPVASAYVGLLARPRAVVLPLTCVRAARGIDVHLQEPWPVGPSVPRSERVAGVAARLEQTVAVAPHQWLLASTLTFESPQAESEGGVGGRTHAVAGVGR